VDPDDERGKPAIVVVVATVPPRRLPGDAWPVPTITSTRYVHGGRQRRALWRLDSSGRHPRGHSSQHGRPSEPEDFELCLALLDEAIARAERWCWRRERTLTEFECRVAEMARTLRDAGMLAPTMSREPIRDEGAAGA
jgi:hypothetical protein